MRCFPLIVVVGLSAIAVPAQANPVTIALRATKSLTDTSTSCSDALSNQPCLTPDVPNNPSPSAHLLAQTSGIPGISPPAFLEPSPNPLQFPTQPAEVQININEPITLDQALILARRNSPAIIQAQLLVDRARARVQEVYASEFPLGTAQLGITRSTSENLFVVPQGGLPGPITQTGGNTSINATIQFNYNLYSGGRRPATIALANSQLRSAQLALETRLNQLRLDVANDYYGLQQADGQLTIAEAFVEQAQRSLRDAQLREQAGVGTRFEVLQAEVALANAVQQRRNALSTQAIARRQIAQRLNLPLNAQIVAADPVAPLGNWNLTLEETIILALKNRAEIEDELLTIEQSEQQEQIARADTLPQVNLFASYGLQRTLGNVAGAGWSNNSQIGIQAQWTFFDAGAARSRINQALINTNIAQSQFQEQRNQVRFQVEQSFYNLQANQDNIGTARIAVERAEENLRLARLRFQAGVGTQSEVITAQSDLTQARVNSLTAVINYNRALASLQRSVTNLPDSQLFRLPN